MEVIDRMLLREEDMDKVTLSVFKGDTRVDVTLVVDDKISTLDITVVVLVVVSTKLVVTMRLDDAVIFDIVVGSKVGGVLRTSPLLEVNSELGNDVSLPMSTLLSTVTDVVLISEGNVLEGMGLNDEVVVRFISGVPIITVDDTSIRDIEVTMELVGVMFVVLSAVNADNISLVVSIITLLFVTVNDDIIIELEKVIIGLTDSLVSKVNTEEDTSVVPVTLTSLVTVGTTVILDVTGLGIIVSVVITENTEVGTCVLLMISVTLVVIMLDNEVVIGISELDGSEDIVVGLV